MIIAIICLFAGVLLGWVVNLQVSAVLTIYIAIGLLACFDSILGGIVATINKNFDLWVFISGFFTNALLSIGIIYIGSKVGLDLYIGVVVVFIMRIFQNFAIIRRFLLNKYKKTDIIENDGLKDNKDNNINQGGQ